MRLVSNDRLPIGRGIAVTAQDILRRRIIESLMCYMEADIAQICADAHEPLSQFDDVFRSLRSLEERGVLSVDNHVLRIPQEYPQAARLVCAQFDRHLPAGSGKHSQVA